MQSEDQQHRNMIYHEPNYLLLYKGVIKFQRFYSRLCKKTVKSLDFKLM